MTRVVLLRRLFVLVTVSVFAMCIGATAGGAEETATYVCPPCGHDNCGETYNEAGACGECGMKLVTLAEVQNRKAHSQGHKGERDMTDRKKVAILVFEGVEIIDYTGPWEVFGSAGFEVFSVSLTREQITTVFGMQVIPNYSLSEHPTPDIVLVPGGSVFKTQNDPVVKKWLLDHAEQADVVLSVCNGAYILAKAGLLTGLKATTTRSLVDGLANAAPDITVVHDVRYVDNGKIVTAGGLSAGMDAALHIVSRYLGSEGAWKVARNLEYDWRSE